MRFGLLTRFARSQRLGIAPKVRRQGLGREIPSSRWVEDTRKGEAQVKRVQNDRDQCVPDSDDFPLTPVPWFDGGATGESVKEGLREAVRTYDFPWSVRLVIRSS